MGSRCRGSIQTFLPGNLMHVKEASANLATWTPLATSLNGAPFTGPGYLSGETPDASVKSVTVRDLVTVSSTPRRFMRLRVTR